MVTRSESFSKSAEQDSPSSLSPSPLASPKSPKTHTACFSLREAPSASFRKEIFRLVPPSSSLSPCKDGKEGYITFEKARYKVQLHGAEASLDPSSAEWEKVAKKTLEFLKDLKALPAQEDAAVRFDDEGNFSAKQPGKKDFIFSLQSQKDKKVIIDFYQELPSFRAGIAVKDKSSAPLHEESSYTPERELRKKNSLLSNSTVFEMLTHLQQNNRNFKFQEIDIYNHFEGHPPASNIPVKLFILDNQHDVPMPGGGSYNDGSALISREHFIKENGYYGAVFRSSGHFFALFADIEHNVLFLMDSLSDDAKTTLSKKYDIEDLYFQIFKRAPLENEIRNLFNKRVQNENVLVNCGVHCVKFLDEMLSLANSHSIGNGGAIAPNTIISLIKEHESIEEYRASWAERLNKSAASDVYENAVEDADDADDNDPKDSENLAVSYPLNCARAHKAENATLSSTAADAAGASH